MNLTPGERATLACLLEVTARKPGNVHPGARFVDTCYFDFVLSAQAIGPVLDNASAGIGKTILDAVTRTKRWVVPNTNLGMILLLTPLAASNSCNLRQSVRERLNQTSVEDAHFVYEAIRLADPGGLGRADQQDCAQPPTESLCAVMQRAQHRDLVALQLSTGFESLWSVGVAAIRRFLEQGLDWEQAIIWTHIELIAAFGDSLIVRKCGVEVAKTAQQMAGKLSSKRSERVHVTDLDAYREFDSWLRTDGNARNPGSTADLVAAVVYVALTEGLLQAPFRIANEAAPVGGTPGQ